MGEKSKQNKVLETEHQLETNLCTKLNFFFLPPIATIVKRSGGEVPEYMLKMKKASRQDKRKMAKSAVRREGITKEAREKQRKQRKRPRPYGQKQPNSGSKNKNAKRQKLHAKKEKSLSTE